MADPFERIQQLAAAARTGISFELTQIAGRDALRVRNADGVATSFLSLAERAALEAALASGPQRLIDTRLPSCEWNAKAGCFEGVASDGTELVIMDVGAAPTAGMLDHLAAMYAVAMQALPRVPTEVARRLEAKANGAWGDGRGPLTLAQIAAKLTLTSIVLSGDPQGTPTVWLADGDLFWGHAVEVALDRRGQVTYAEIAG